MKDEEKKEFLKEYKMSLISGSILTISPSLAGILLWNRLPEKIATHFDQHNLANGCPRSSDASGSRSVTAISEMLLYSSVPFLYSV